MRTLLLAFFTLVGCAHVKPEDETVKEHLDAARLHDLRANQELAQYDPNQSRLRVAPLNRLGRVGPSLDLMESYNPTDAHAMLADQELRKANEHVAAAKKLEVFEAQACAGVSAADRSSCPLLASSVMRVEATDQGFTLKLKPHVDAEQVFRRLRCHLAFAVASGFDAPSCPLFIKGTELRLAPHAILFVGETAAVAFDLRVQARRVFVGVEVDRVSVSDPAPSP